MANKYKLETYRDNGWIWDVIREDGSTATYRTNGNGEGLFFSYDDGRPAKQIQGTTQFRLPQNRAAVLRILKRDYALVTV